MKTGDFQIVLKKNELPVILPISEGERLYFRTAS